MHVTGAVFPYTVTARRGADLPIRIGIVARTPADAITTAQELYPGHLISSATIHPDWHDEPA
jgi:hypothetical protein